MHRVLYVGDVHCTPEEIGDCQKLIGLVCETAKSFKVDSVVFLGDVFHTHSVVRVEVLNFWKKAFRSVSDALCVGGRVVCLVGNHDQGSNGQHALFAYVLDGLVVVDSPFKIPECDVLLLPYTDSKDKFIGWCNGCPTKVVVCHQTFDGSMYENGFFAKEAIDSNLIPQSTILSGHIHKPQEFGKVTYVGSPRWRTASDANIDRSLVVVDHDTDGTIKNKTQIDTGATCRQIKALVDRPEAPIELPLDPGHDWRIDIEGPLDWIERRRPLISGPGVKVRSLPVMDSTHKVRESDGIAIAFQKFLVAYKAKLGTPTETLLEIARSRLKCMIT